MSPTVEALRHRIERMRTSLQRARGRSDHRPVSVAVRDDDVEVAIDAMEDVLTAEEKLDQEDHARRRRHVRALRDVSEGGGRP